MHKNSENYSGVVDPEYRLSEPVEIKHTRARVTRIVQRHFLGFDLAENELI